MKTRLSLKLWGAIALGLVVVVGTALHGCGSRDAPEKQPSIEVITRQDEGRTIAIVGDRIELRVTASQLWVFRGDELLTACPDVACPRIFGGFTLVLTVEQLGRHRVLAAIAPTPASARTFDDAVLSARAHGARLRLSVIDVVAP